MQIKYIRQKGKGITVIAVIEECGDTTEYTLMDKHFDISGYYEGMIISEADVATLAYEDERCRATRVALKLLSISELAPRALYLKLTTRGFSKKCSSAVTEYVISLGYIKEREAIRELILELANKELFGKRKIYERLCRRHYNGALVKEELSSLAMSGEIDYKENAKRLIEKKLPHSARECELEKLLYKYGYSLGTEDD